MAKRSFEQRLRPWVPAILWIAVIAWESTSTFSSEHTGHWLYAIMSFVFGPVNHRYFDPIHAVLRKAGHFVGYGLLSYFFFLGWRGRYLSKVRLSRDELRAAWGRLWRPRWALLAVAMTFVVAALDEGHQTMLPSRTGVFRDVVLDTLGGVFAQILIFAANPRRPVEVREEEKVS